MNTLLAITDADHYGRLGVTRLASTDEASAAYEKRCEELNSKKLEEEELINKELDLLKESFTILSTEEERRLYDWSMSRSGQPERRSLRVGTRSSTGSRRRGPNKARWLLLPGVVHTLCCVLGDPQQMRDISPHAKDELQPQHRIPSLYECCT
ncbi:hypothetical protein PAHAL_3G438000 [Panicum hallii]|uniref:J domain-containing protein n=1 Tax=Panicum hallii TaxID=206008 RepID=A0A2T8KLB1_9POAL|nr:hypothetical protein PAHAL_3G438000 [Panicum hallii]